VNQSETVQPQLDAPVLLVRRMLAQVQDALALLVRRMLAQVQDALALLVRRTLAQVQDALARPEQQTQVQPGALLQPVQQRQVPPPERARLRPPVLPVPVETVMWSTGAQHGWLSAPGLIQKVPA
jgi:hypothetical protein